MTKKFLTIFIIILFLLPAQFSFAKIFSSSTQPAGNLPDIPDPLTQYAIKDEASGILQKITGEWQKFNEWGTGFWTKHIEPYFGKYIDRVEQNVRQGLAEEKEEYKQDFFKAIGKVWERIKDFVLHK